MAAPRWLVAGLVLSAPTLLPAQERQPAPTSRVVAATVYPGQALVTRQVDVPAGNGIVEVVVAGLPPQAVPASLSAEGGDGLRILSTRSRTRAVPADTRAEVRAREQALRELTAEAQRLRRDIEVHGQNLQLLQKLENFTAATMQNLSEKGLLRSEPPMALSTYIMDRRTALADAEVRLHRRVEANAEAAQFAQRQFAELTAGSVRTELDAVIVLDRAAERAGSIRLSYLVGPATWRPIYRLRAGGEADPVQLLYLGSVEQQTGEDWPDAQVTLSTAQPSLGAAPPDLLPLRLTLDPDAPEHEQVGPATGFGRMGGGMGGMGITSLEQMASQSDPAQQAASKALANAAAAENQAAELDVQEGAEAAGEAPEMVPSVAFRLPGRLDVPSRPDPQLAEVARIELKPEFFDRAVPVLTPHVYRLANLNNESGSVLLPGEATMYVGDDFVGRTRLPLVAVGEPFTVGFGVDPQVTIGRRLMSKSRSIQGGNQVFSYDFRVALKSYRRTPVTVQVWDRLPLTAPEDAVAVKLGETAPPLSQDPPYERNGRPENLLRWDLTVEPGTVGEKARLIRYAFTVEYARDLPPPTYTAGGLAEAPIGGGATGMGGMGGGFRPVSPGRAALRADYRRD